MLMEIIAVFCTSSNGQHVGSSEFVMELVFKMGVDCNGLIFMLQFSKSGFVFLIAMVEIQDCG
jgi:hypothetical protein